MLLINKVKKENIFLRLNSENNRHNIFIKEIRNSLKEKI